MPKSSTQPGSAAPNGSSTPKICCLGPNRALIEELTPALMRCLPGAAMCDVRHYPAPGALESELAGARPEICFLDMVSDRSRALALIPEWLAARPATSIIILLGANDSDLILKALRLGASEFLLQPFTPQQLETALSRLIRHQSAAATGPGSQGRVYCVLPAKGACGASTVASNLALLWKRAGSTVLLADMDPLAGILSFVFRATSTYTFIDVLHRADTLDADLWKGMVARIKGLDLLLAPEGLTEGISEVRDASPIIGYARRHYETVVLDANGAYGPWNLSMARGCDHILLVTTNELPALQGAQRVLAYLDMNEVDRSKLSVILNRYNDEIGLNRDVVASALHSDVIEVIPSDYQTVQAALVDGKPIPGATGVGKALAALAKRLQGGEKQQKKESAPMGLLSFFSRAG